MLDVLGYVIGQTKEIIDFFRLHTSSTKVVVGCFFGFIASGAYG